MGVAFGYWAYFDAARMWRPYDRLVEQGADWWQQAEAWIGGLFNNRIFDLFVNQTYSVMSNDVLTAIPLFLFMGYVVERANIVDRLFSRVGAADDLARGRSTFMVEMVETAAILNQATARSLVVLDEIGRGTATFDGLSIAWATMEHLHEKNCARALFATHFHELTALTETYPQVQNLHVVAHIGDSDGDAAMADGGNNSSRREVTLLYKVVPGISDQSFGIHVAELVRFPPKVVAMAKRKADELEDFSGKHSDGGETSQAAAASKEEVEAGSAMLKAVLQQWKREVESEGLGKEAQVARMRQLVEGNSELLKNPFFQSVKAL